VAFRTQIEIQALQAFISEAHYPSTHTLNFHACRRFNSLRFCTAVVVCFCLIYSPTVFIVDSVVLLCSLCSLCLLFDSMSECFIYVESFKCDKELRTPCAIRSDVRVLK